MSFHDLRAFMEALERQGRLQRVGAPVDPELETTSLSLRALREGGPALLMEHPVGSNHAYLGNLYGHRDRIEAALAGRPLASLRELGELLAAIREPRWPSSLRDALGSWPQDRHPRAAIGAGLAAPVQSSCLQGLQQRQRQQRRQHFQRLSRLQRVHRRQRPLQGLGRRQVAQVEPVHGDSVRAPRHSTCIQILVLSRANASAR